MISVQMRLNKCGEPHLHLCVLMFCVVLVCLNLYTQAFVVACVCVCVCNTLRPV